MRPHSWRRSKPAGPRFDFTFQPGERQQFLMQFKPHRVVAVGDNPREVTTVAGGNAPSGAT
jgi:hypothetical protein